MKKITKATIKVFRSANDIDDITEIAVYKGKTKLFWVSRHLLADFTTWTICLRHNYRYNILDLIEEESGIRFEDFEIEEVLF